MKKSLSCLCLILLAAPMGAAQWEGYATCNHLKEGKNNFTTLCRDNGVNRDTIQNQLAHIEDEWIEKQQKEEVIEWYTVFNNYVKDSINGTGNDACEKFIKAYKAYVEEQYSKPFEKELAEQKDTSEKKASEKKKDKSVQADKSANNTEDEEQNNSDANENKDFFSLVGFIVLLLLIMLLFIQNRQLNKKLRGSSNNNDNMSGVNSRIGILEDKQNKYSQKLAQIEQELKDLKNMKVSKSSTIPVPPVTPASPTSTISPAQAQHDVVLYVTLDASNDRLFKQQTNRTPQHLYEIHLDNANATTGNLYICSNIEPAFAQKFIGDRNSYFKICEVHASVASPTRIVMKKSGQVVKRDNSWEVIMPPQIELN